MKHYTLLLLIIASISCNKIQGDKGRDKTVVGIQAYNGFPNHKTKIIATTIDSFYNVRSVVLPEKEIYKQAFVHVKSPRYRADSIIYIERRNLPDSLDYIIGLTEKDVSTTKKANGKVLEPASKY